ncbi:MAG TPA: PIN domain-containing protein [Candidatus Desulfaltia sp.]|nr:PIN domain-containing protein [Candidatus Desulfaltia sp.]
MKPVYLLDSIVLIDHLRGIEAATKWLGKLRDGEAVLSVITRAEVLSGGTEEEAIGALELCDEFECLPLTRDDATFAAALRRKHGWKLPDAFQATVALRAGLKLITRDTRGFDGKKHPFVLIPYKLE